MTDQKHLDTLKKLKALADREDAPPHEREAAAQMLRKLLAKYDVDLEALMTEEISIHFLDKRIRLQKFEHKLSAQVLGMVTDSHEVRLGYRNWKKRSGLYVYCTESQAIQFRLLFMHYLEAFRASLEDYVEAFIMKNNMYPETPSTTEKVVLSAQDLERLRRLLAIKSGIKPVARPVPRLKG